MDTTKQSATTTEDPNALVFCPFRATPSFDGLTKIDQSGDVSTYEVRSQSRDVYEFTAEDLADLESFKL